MPKILDRLVQQLKDKGHDEKSSYAIATKALQKSGNLKKGTTEATEQGKMRGDMTPGERAKDRQSKYTGRPESDFTYNAETNRATLKRRRK